MNELHRDFLYSPEQEDNKIQEIVDEQPEESRALTKKYIHNSESLSPKESKKLKEQAQKFWLQRHQGQKGGAKEAMEELEDKIETERKRKIEARTLHNKFYEIFSKNSSPEEIGILRKQFEKAYPDQLQGIAALFDLLPTLQASAKHDARQLHFTSSEEKQNFYQSLTEYQFLLTNFISENQGNDGFLQQFYDLGLKLSQRQGIPEQFRIRWSGAVTQVAIFKALKAVGLHAVAASPKIDALDSIDMQVTEGNQKGVIQIKGTQAEKPEFVEIKTRVPYGATEVKTDKTVTNISSHFFRKAQQFAEKFENYKRRQGPNKEVHAYMLVVPAHMIDRYTGEPSQELINFIRQNYPSAKNNTPEAIQAAA